jgi:(p)ppGpp synthase/HD superfamily hydrolase
MENLLSERFEAALVLMFRLHRSQFRKGTTIPYISHLLGVAALVMEDGGNEDETIAALLHDAIEDQGGDETRQAIGDQFGSEVSAIVEGCTDTDIDPKPPWRERKEQHLRSLATASISVLRVMMADKLHNARSIVWEAQQRGDAVWDKFKGGKAGTLWYYQSFLQEVRRRGCDSPMVQELDKIVRRWE